MKTPIVVVSDSSSVALFRDAERATRYMEAIDVADGVYDAFDAAGLRLDVQVDPHDQSIRIREVPGRTAEPDELRRIIRRYVLAVQETRPELVALDALDLASGDLQRLVAEIEAIDQRFKDRSVTSRVQRALATIRGLFGGGQ